MAADIREYAKTTDLQSLLYRYGELVFELSGLHSELAMVQGQEKRQKIRAYMESPETTVSGRERAADYASLECTCEIFNLKGQINSLTEEKEYIIYLLDRGSYGTDG